MGIQALKPQDLAVALKLLSAESWTFPTLAAQLHMSASEAHGAVRRLHACRLYNPFLKRVSRSNLLEFLLHGLRYAFPAEEGPLARGVPTAWSADPLRRRLLVGEDAGAVWPRPDGETWGHAIAPLYKGAAAAALGDPALHELLALVDALRAGRARERGLACDELSRRLAA